MREIGLGKIACIVAVFCFASAVALPAQTLTTILSFNGNAGIQPESLIQGDDGNLFGVMQNGGAYSWGTIYEMTTSGTQTTLYSFCREANCPDGGFPISIMQGSDGSFYGITFVGGDSTCGEGCGNGTIFRFSPSGKITALHEFCSESNCADGGPSEGGLLQASNGNFYGTTFSGGNQSSNGSGYGTLFEITPTGTFTTLYKFCGETNCDDGENPAGGLVEGPNGNLYGTAYWGGTHDSGTVFLLTPRGRLITLHSFTRTSGSKFTTGPNGIIQTPDGSLYGTTTYGGSANYGTIFKLSPSGKFTNLYNFCSLQNCADGANPFGLNLGTDGNLYGTTANGGTGLPRCSNLACGTIFKITPEGQLTTLYSFCTVEGCPDGESPGVMLFYTNGNFYGDTESGGESGYGTFFSFSVGLGAFVTATPTFGHVGRSVQILGNDLTGTSSVGFNGVAAKFEVVSDTYLKAEVPTGATTGKIEVTTPSGTISSNVPFQVLP